VNFLSPYCLLLLVTIPALYFLQNRHGRGHIRFSSIKGVNPAVPAALRIRNYIRGLSYIILALIATAAARPQVSVGGGKMPSEGIDMVMVIDVSGSMKTIDKLPADGAAIPDIETLMQTETRLAKVKQVSRRFVRTRKEDRIGLIAFAGKSVITSPLTLDYRLLDRQIASLDFNLTTDGTALGMALASGINMLKDSERKEKAVIILSDGISNAGDIEPVQAAYLSRNYNIKVYPIEMGTFAENTVLREQAANWSGEEVKLLDQIADFTGGKHFSIPDGDALYAVYNEIERAAKSRVEVAGYANYMEIYPHLVAIAVLLLVMQAVLLNTRYRKIP